MARIYQMPFSITSWNTTNNLTNTDFTDADVKGHGLICATTSGFTQSQLKSTASYKMKDLSGISLEDSDLSGWDFHQQNLTNASFRILKTYKRQFLAGKSHGAILNRRHQ